ncbi:MAG: hypothetical protein H0T75_04305 [Rhizobiales bacterium]|nr:hypothetical protein [Hyphomicrobiales bacterium]
MAALKPVAVVDADADAWPEHVDAAARAYHAERPEPQEARPPAFTDEALALRFAEKHAHDLRYVAPWGKWQIWSVDAGNPTTR